jgi:hypothetical protein
LSTGNVERLIGVPVPSVAKLAVNVANFDVFGAMVPSVSLKTTAPSLPKISINTVAVLVVPMLLIKQYVATVEEFTAHGINPW